MNHDSRSVLVVEDDESIRETVRELLEFEGYRVHTASNGREALSVLSRIESPCVIFLDLMMPVMDGWQFLDARRKDERLSSLPVIVVTAAGNLAQAPGANEIVSKPPDVDALLAMLDRHCRRFEHEHQRVA